MEGNVFIEVGLPISLIIIMIGMGLSLTAADFRRVGEQPKAVAVGTVAQLLLMPIIGFLLAWFWGGGVLAAGLVLVAVLPGGTTSNLLSYLAKANLALSITLTVIASIATILTIPFAVNLALQWFTGEGEVIRLPFIKTFVTMMVIVVIPVGIGMLINRWQPVFAKRVEPLISAFSALVLVGVIVAIVYMTWAELPGYLATSWKPVLSLNLAALVLGFVLGKLFQLSVPDTLTVMIETGIKNSTIALTIALSLLKNAELAIPAAVYGLLMYASALLLAAVGRKLAR